MDKKLIPLTMFLLIFILSLLSMYFGLKSSEVKINQQVLSSTSALGESNKPSYYGFKICYLSNCMDVSAKEEENLSKEGEISKLITERVEPFLLENNGGKDIVSNRGGSFSTWKNDYVPDTSDLQMKIERILLVESPNRVVKVGKHEAPGTDGTYAPRYIEVDNSRQKLYAWIDGKVQREILLSASKYHKVVYGVFPIIDKGVSPMAPTQRYMPYWMAFYYDKDIPSWYGLHGLVWWYDEFGRKVYEPESNIGVRRSGGCIRMVIEDAKYLYEIYQKGDHILIHE